MTGDGGKSLERTWDQLPRDWLMANIEMGRAAELKAFVAEAVQWGFDEPQGLTNKLKRIRFLRECREKAWTLLSQGAEVPPPGKVCVTDEPARRSPTKAKPAEQKRAVSPPRPFAPRSVSPEDVFPPKYRGRATLSRVHKPVAADLCEITADECNEFLRSLPPLPLAGE